jgi:hypothetical protein
MADETLRGCWSGPERSQVVHKNIMTKLSVDYELYQGKIYLLISYNISSQNYLARPWTALPALRKAQEMPFLFRCSMSNFRPSLDRQHLKVFQIARN